MGISEKEYTDFDLVNLFNEPGKKEYAFNLILERYKERIYWHLRKFLIHHDDTDDVLQETFVKVWKGLEGFRAESKLYTWLYRIATNEALSFLRSKRRRFLLPLVDVEQQLLESLSSDPFFEGDALQLKLQKAILQLPEKQRLVFNMKYFDDLKYEEISEVLGITVGSLKASYHHAVKKIEKYLTED
ncbi:MAG: RNA polymerase sigma factor [Bacteroidales bacterium]|nr:RNA polymerase sigma factor [Bacteroidales bacterium]